MVTRFGNVWPLKVQNVEGNKLSSLFFFLNFISLFSRRVVQIFPEEIEIPPGIGSTKGVRRFSAEGS